MSNPITSQNQLSPNQKAIVVFSGGQDSTTCLAYALQTFAEVEAVTFDYGQRHANELECAKKIAAMMNVRHHILDLGLLNQLAPSALTRQDIAVKAGENGTLPSTFVPGRNLLFFSFAAILAKQVGAKHIVVGVSQTDYSGYPDCRDGFIKSLNVTLNLAMNDEFVIHTPLMWIDKKQTWALADQLGVFNLVRTATLTCYHGIVGDGCGECPACRLRRQGLEAYLVEKSQETSEAGSETRSRS